MPFLSSIAPATTAATALSNLILVSPQKPNSLQPLNFPSDIGNTQAEAFVFQTEGEQTLTAESDIPDHYVEDNTAVQDQISEKPTVYVVRGYIGELNDIAPDFLQPLKAVANKLVAIGGYAPQLSVTALIAYNEALFLYQVAQNTANAAVAAWTSIPGFGTGGAPQNKQQKAFQTLYGYWGQRRLFNVLTPWAMLKNMAIVKLRAIQEEDTNQITDFELTLKEIRFASTGISTGGFLDSAVNFQGQSSTQAAPLVNYGTTTPVPGESLGAGIASVA